MLVLTKNKSLTWYYRVCVNIDLTKNKSLTWYYRVCVNIDLSLIISRRGFYWNSALKSKRENRHLLKMIPTLVQANNLVIRWDKTG